jgi:hypothetical protein
MEINRDGFAPISFFNDAASSTAQARRKMKAIAVRKRSCCVIMAAFLKSTLVASAGGPGYLYPRDRRNIIMVGFGVMSSMNGLSGGTTLWLNREASAVTGFSMQVAKAGVMAPTAEAS